MKRRDFSLQLASAGLGLALVGTARAQGAPVEGQQFQRLQTVVAVSLPAGKKVEVLEFFSYACPHCFSFESALEVWIKQLPSDVLFRQVPVGFMAPALQKAFFALEEMGQRDALHRKIFSAFHVQRTRLNTEAEVLAFVTGNGIDGAKFTEALKSFAVNTKISRTQQLMSGYKIDSVPMLGVHGRFTTSPSMAGTSERALAVTDTLIQRARQGV